MCLPWFNFYCCVKAPQPKEFGEERVYFINSSLGMSGEKLKAGTEAEAVEELCLQARPPLHGCFSLLAFFLFLCVVLAVLELAL